MLTFTVKVNSAGIAGNLAFAFNRGISTASLFSWTLAIELGNY
jgi:hypothetical protein